MKKIFFLILALIHGVAQASPGTNPVIIESAGNYEMSWQTRVGSTYQVEMSPNLANWMEVGSLRNGTGGALTFGFVPNGGKMFLRVREDVAAPFGPDFLAVPANNATILLKDGVCFGLDVDAMPVLPDKVRFYRRRPTDTAFTQIGAVTEFAEIDGVKTLQGSATWVTKQSDLGDWVVMAMALDENRCILGKRERNISIVDTNSPPTVTITSRITTRDNPEDEDYLLLFETAVSDPDEDKGDFVGRVEFYKDGIFIGLDSAPPYGDNLLIVTLPQSSGSSSAEPHERVLGGTHQITAIAYDSNGAASPESAPFEIVIPPTPMFGNRPIMTVSQPTQSEFTVNPGDEFTVVFAASDPDDQNFSDITNVRLVNQSIRFDDMDGGILPTTLGFSFQETGSFEVDTANWGPGRHVLYLFAQDFAGNRSLPFFLLVNVVEEADPDDGIQTDPEIRAEMAAQFLNQLQVDGGVLSNASFTGETLSAQIFTEGLQNDLSFDEGVLLTTGVSEGWDGENNTARSSELIARDSDDNRFLPRTIWDFGDQQLAVQAGVPYASDVTTFEFDYFSTDGQIEIDYQFGSEEWIDYVNPLEGVCFNDVIRITVNDVPISYTPDCLDFVGLGSITREIDAFDIECIETATNVSAIREHLFLDNTPDENSGLAPLELQYDGLTRGLTAHAFVEPGQVHLVKIQVFDARDQNYDSGIFIGEIRTSSENK